MSTDAAVQEACETIDRLGDPDNMSKREWVEFLDLLIEELRSRKDAAEHELSQEGGG